MGVIEIPHTPVKPEVFVVNFDDESDNRQLHGGVDLQTALRQSVASAQVIEAGGSSSANSGAGGSIGSVGSSVGGSIIGGNVGSVGSTFDSGIGFIGNSDDIINSGDSIFN